MAYLLHIQAWERKLANLRSGDDSGLWGLVTLAGLASANPRVAANGVNRYAESSQNTQSKRNAVDEQVLETWHMVEQVAARYGVWIPGRK